jgi:hypothetical protein
VSNPRLLGKVWPTGCDVSSVWPKRPLECSQELSQAVTTRSNWLGSVPAMLIALSILVAFGVFYSGQTDFA